jgi:hypothetical protein
MLSPHLQPSASSSSLHAPNFMPNSLSFTNFTSTTDTLVAPTDTIDRDTGLPLSFPPPTAQTVNPEHSAFLRPRVPFKLAAFNVRTLARVGQQAALSRTLETLAIDICCLSETRIQDSSSVIRLTSPANSERTFHLRLSGDTEAMASGQAGVGIALSERAEAALLDWIPIDSRLCAVRLEGSCKVSRQKNRKRGLFVVAAYAPTDCSPDAVKDRFYERVHDLLQKAPKSDIVILAGDLNASVGRLLPTETHLGGQFGLDGHRSDNGDRLLSLCSDNRLFLSSTSFRRSKRRTATWRPPSLTQDWKQIDHIAISYSWRGCVQDCRSFWTTCLESDHALVCARLSMCFGGRPKRKAAQLDVAKLSEPTVLANYQNELALKLAAVPQSSVEQHWKGIEEAMHVASLNCCGLTQRMVKHWVSARSLQLLDARRSIPLDGEHNVARTNLTREIKASIKRDREAWWIECAKEMESASATGDFRKLFHLIRTTGCKRLGVSEAICEADGSPIYNLKRRLDRWAEFFMSQFNWPPAPATSISMITTAPWSAPSEAPTEAEVLRELQALKRHKAPGPDNLPPALFKDGGSALVKELLSLIHI